MQAEQKFLLYSGFTYHWPRLPNLNPLSSVQQRHPF